MSLIGRTARGEYAIRLDGELTKATCEGEIVFVNEKCVVILHGDRLRELAIEKVIVLPVGHKHGNTLDLVREFHEVFDQPIEDHPKLTNGKVNELRLDLLFEELTELRTAVAAEDKVAVLDALTDLQYVLDGAYLSWGYHRIKSDAMAEIHRSNLSKLEEGKAVKRSDGKVLKGKSYSPPNLHEIMSLHFNPGRYDVD